MIILYFNEWIGLLFKSMDRSRPKLEFRRAFKISIVKEQLMFFFQENEGFLNHVSGMYLINVSLQTVRQWHAEKNY